MSQTRARVRVVDEGVPRTRSDRLATEEPMEIRLRSGAELRTLAVTMRTPGNDFELAAGFLYGEGVVSDRDDIVRIEYCTDRDVDVDQRYNIVTVDLRPGSLPDLRPLERHFYTSSSCGVCGKASIEALEIKGCPVVPQRFTVEPEVVYALPDRLREAQGLFDSTGGLHAAAVFDPSGELVMAREDVGRHNAVDKVVGRSLLDGKLPFNDSILMVSGRASYEIMQKSVVAGVPVVCAVSAPSSLAVSVGERFGITLVGFLRGRHFNVYSVPERIATEH